MTLRGRLTLLVAGVLLVTPFLRACGASEGPTALAEPAPESPAPRLEARPPASATLELVRRELPPSAAGRSGKAAEPLAAPQDAARLVETLPLPAGAEDIPGPLRVEYTLHPELTRRIEQALRRGRVELGHVIVLEPRSGRLLAYVSTEPERLPATRPYPAASLMKVVTAAAVLEHAPERARRPCLFQGSPWRLTRARLDPPQRGRSVSLRRAMATSNNQCFAQLAVHALGPRTLHGEIERLGLLRAPAPGHEPGRLDHGDDPLELGRLGCGLAGCEITPLAAARLAAALAEGRLVEPHWIARVVDAAGREMTPAPPEPRRVLSPRLAAELRRMLVDTTRTGTARRAFHTRRGPLLGPVRVAGKTGSVNGSDPSGRYEWFIGVAPAERPEVAVATLVVQSDLYWISSSQLAAEVLKTLFCPKGVCRVDAVRDWLEPAAPDAPQKPASGV